MILLNFLEENQESNIYQSYDVEYTENESSISQYTQSSNNNNLTQKKQEYSDITAYNEPILTTHSTNQNNNTNNIEVFQELDAMENLSVQESSGTAVSYSKQNTTQFAELIENKFEEQPQFSKPIKMEFVHYNNFDNSKKVETSPKSQSPLRTSTIIYEKSLLEKVLHTKEAINQHNYSSSEQTSKESSKVNKIKVLKSVINEDSQTLEHNPENNISYKKLLNSQKVKENEKSLIIDNKKHPNEFKTFEKPERDYKSQYTNEKNFEEYLDYPAEFYSTKNSILFNEQETVRLNSRHEAKLSNEQSREKVFYVIDAENPSSDIHIDQI